MKGLILLPFWVDMILNHNKTWEIRSTKTSKRETIGLIASGTKQVFGDATIVDCFPLTKELFEENFEKHRINCRFEELPVNYRYVWVLDNVKKYDIPKNYTHPRGAQIWVNLEMED